MTICPYIHLVGPVLAVRPKASIYISPLTTPPVAEAVGKLLLPSSRLHGQGLDGTELPVYPLHLCLPLLPPVPTPPHPLSSHNHLSPDPPIALLDLGEQIRSTACASPLKRISSTEGLLSPAELPNLYAAGDGQPAGSCLGLHQAPVRYPT